MGINIAPDDAFTALARRVAGDDPVTATFRNIDDGVIVLNVEVDGQLQDFDIRLTRKGEWGSVLNREI